MGRSPAVKGAKKEQQVRQMLLDKAPIRAISRTTGFSRKAIETYRDESLPEKLVKARDAAEVAEADTLLDQLKAAREKALSLLDKAEKGDDLKAAAAFLREIREQIKLLAELEGRLAAQPQINILINPEWVQLRTLIISALGPYPEARQAVLDAIHE